MKRILIIFDDKEFEELKKRKGKLTWHDFIINYHLNNGNGKSKY